MPNIFLDGQQNLAGLSVPGVYGDIILPTPLLIGTPTNIEGVVGVGSWGPTNALIPATQSSDAALSLGASVLRYASSGLPGPKGNRETFVWLAERERGGISESELEAAAREVEP